MPLPFFGSIIDKIRVVGPLRLWRAVRMRSWGQLSRTMRKSAPCAAICAAAVWFGVPALSLSHALEGQALLLARTAEPQDIERRLDLAPWGPVSPLIEIPPDQADPEALPDPGVGSSTPPTDDQLLRLLVEWVLLIEDDGSHSFGEFTRFIKANPAWPRLGALRNKAERAIAPEDSDHSILAWFEAYPPRTVAGASAYAVALERTDKRDEAASAIRNAWIAFDMTAADEAALVSRFGDYLGAEHHRARLDRLLWDNRRSAATRQMKRVDRDYRALADARLRLMRHKRNGGTALKSVPAGLSNDPGLVYEWVRWNRRKEKNDEAIAALLSYEGTFDHPKRWWTERQILARRALLADDPETAYRLVRNHGLDRSVARADAEFMAGWIALRFLGDPRTAFEHFSGLYDSVRYPISLARAAYWSGRAADAAGEEQIARQWFRTAATHTTTFYGQLAAQRIGIATTTLPSLEPDVSPAARAEFDRDELVRAVRLLVSLRDPSNAGHGGAARDASDPYDEPEQFLVSRSEDVVLKQFLRHIARRAKSAAEWKLAGQLARDSGRIDIAVYIARRAARDGVVLGELGYPTMVLAEDVPPEPALLHALIRQESAFDVEARSRAGARGLMQLMPATAKRVARKLRVKNHSTARLTSDPHHNVALGGAYLDSMLARYEGSMVMALAAYNAGPHRVDKWLEDYGDPRGQLEDAIDWIESIPFSETRNYVQRIMEALPIYRQKLHGAQVALLRAEDIAGRLPGYAAPTSP
ncbi:MAG: lytic transglycosylase domain-containing protein [Rhodospirillales bacterium]|nr:MAG: lytic transglycosylase domain-containing protein [Rhodospirillales bacterium]